MKYCLTFLAVALLLCGCGSNVKKPFTIQGHNPRNVVLYASKEIKTWGLRLPPGYYYPVQEFNGYGLLVRNYRMEFAHPAGVMARDLVGQWFQGPGGVNVDYDPAQRPPYGFVRTEGLSLSSASLPDEAIQVVSRAGAWNSPQAAFLRGQLSGFRQQQMYRDGQNAAVQGALMAIPR